MLSDWPAGTAKTFRLADPGSAALTYDMRDQDGRPWPVRITRLAFDLVGDDEPGFDVPLTDDRLPRAFSFSPGRTGEFELAITAFDERGCRGESQSRRMIVVP